MMLPLGEIFEKYGIKPNGVLHLGGNDGAERDFYRDLNVKKVFWVEAIPDIYKILKENLKDYPNQFAALACLSNENGKIVEFKISNNGAQSSSFLDLGLHKQIHPEVEYVDTMPLQTIRVDSLFRILDTDVSMLDFLNIDLQGAELLALEGMGDMLKQFKWINTEVNRQETYVGCPLIEDMDYFLLQNGFERVETGEWVGECWSDAFYIKTR